MRYRPAYASRVFPLLPSLPHPSSVYDITNTPHSHMNEAIKTLNRFTRDTFGLGGIFHGAVEVNGEEYSFGYCPYGTGVRTCSTVRTGWALTREAGVLVPPEGQPQLHVSGKHTAGRDLREHGCVFETAALLGGSAASRQLCPGFL